MLFCLLATASVASAQKITGTVYNERGDLLTYSSITIKGSTTGASANNKARFLINSGKGNFTLVCQHIGYAAQEKLVTVGNEDVDLTFILKDVQLTMKEVVIKSNGEDPAYAIIRSAIQKRPYYAEQVKGFRCDLYAKDLIKLRKLPKKIFGQKVPDEDRQDMGLDSAGAGIIYLSESVAKVALQLPDQFKMNVISSRVSGSGGFGFTFPTFISFYNNNVNVFAQQLNPRGFVSPIADGAIGFYRYKFMGSFFEDGKEINSIKVTPRRNYEPLFSGIINITEGDWRIHSLDLLLTKTSQLELLDTLAITQFHVPVNAEQWRVKNQLLHFNFNQFGIDAIGNFLNVYSNYELNPVFKKSDFDRVIIKYDTAVNKRSRNYWDSTRPVPLEKEEVKDYLVKDSLYVLRKDSVISQYSIDSLKKRQGPVQLWKVFWSGLNRTHYSKKNTFQWGVNSLIQNAEYNTAEGLVVLVPVYFNKYLRKSQMNLAVKPYFRYGFGNKHFNTWADVILTSRNRGTEETPRNVTWRISGGRRVSQFYKDAPILPVINTFNTLWYGQNYMKNYENAFVGIGYEKRLESGVEFKLKGLWEDRNPLNNVTDYTFKDANKIKLTPNYPTELMNQQFDPHQALVLSATISVKPGQRYIQFPRYKVAIGSKYPTFTFEYSKGVDGFLGSDVDFDKWRFSVNDDVNFKLKGLLKYRLGTGGFFNSAKVPVQDYQHFNGNQSLIYSEYVNSYQLSGYYANSNKANNFGFGFIEHHFNGLLTNKIPYFNRLKWNLVAGVNAFYINDFTNHVELFVGFENIFKFMRVDLVARFDNGGRIRSNGIVIGFDGILGGSFNNSLFVNPHNNGF